MSRVATRTRVPPDGGRVTSLPITRTARRRRSSTSHTTPSSFNDSRSTAWARAAKIVTPYSSHRRLTVLSHTWWWSRLLTASASVKICATTWSSAAFQDRTVPAQECPPLRGSRVTRRPVVNASASAVFVTAGPFSRDTKYPVTPHFTV